MENQQLTPTGNLMSTRFPNNSSAISMSFKFKKKLNHPLVIQQLFLSPSWPLSQQPMRPEAEWAIDLRGHEGERNNCFNKIQLVGQKYPDKTTLSSKTRFRRHCFGFQSWRFLLLVGYNIQPSSSSTNQIKSIENRPLLGFY